MEAQEGVLPLLLDPFRDDLQPQPPRDPDHGPHDRGGRRVGPDAGDEALVDLQAPEREPAEVPERRVAGPEVVDGDRHPPVPEAAEQCGDGVDVSREDALGHLELDQLRRHPRLLEDPDEARFEIWRTELRGRDVRGDDDRCEPAVEPAPEVRRRGAQDPLAERDDQAPLLGDRNELVWQHEPALRVVPADQRLRADDAPRLHLHLRLEVEDELSARERPAEPRLRLEGLHRPERQLGPEGLEPAPFPRLGLTECRVGALHQAPRVPTVAGEERDPDTRAERDRPPSDLERAREDVPDLSDDGRAVGRVFEGDERDPELVGTDTGEDVPHGHRGGEPAGGGAEHLVSGRSPERLVEGREAVDVEDHEGKRLRVGPRVRERPVELRLEAGAVREARERVAPGEELDPLPRRGALRKVGADGHVVRRRAALVLDRRDREAGGIRLAGPAPALDLPAPPSVPLERRPDIGMDVLAQLRRSEEVGHPADDLLRGETAHRLERPVHHEDPLVRPRHEDAVGAPLEDV